MIEEVKVFTEEREEFLANDIKNYINKIGVISMKYILVQLH